MVPETVFKAGSNRVEVFAISGSEDRPSLASLRKQGHISYSLSEARSGTNEEFIVSSTGETIRIVPGAMRGVVGRVQQRSGSTWVSGWAFDKAHLRPADEVVVFVDSEADHYGHAVVNRSDLVEGFKSPSLYQAGFRIVLPGYIFDRDPPPVVRVFAISSRGVASELRYKLEYGDGSRKLYLGKGAREIKYSLARNRNAIEESMVSPSGKTIRIVPGAMRGVVGRVQQRSGSTWVSGWALLLAAGLAPDRLGAAEGGVSLSGQITDQTGAAIPHATVRLEGNRARPSEIADELGRYRFDRLLPGSYSLTASARGYILPEPRRLELAASKNLTVNLVLRVSFPRQEVAVDTEANRTGLDLDTAVGTQILRGQELDELPDDPDELRAYLQALAGPGAAGVMVDGFSDGEIPTKEDIREIRIEDDDYSAEYDEPGAGGIQIFTRAGRDKFRGQAHFGFGDESLNSRSPFAENRAPYQRRSFAGSLGGGRWPRTRRSTFPRRAGRKTAMR